MTLLHSLALVVVVVISSASASVGAFSSQRMLSYETIGDGYTPNSEVTDHVSLYMDVVQADHHIIFGLVLTVFSMCFS